MVLHNVYFSGKGTTKACADCIASEMGMEVKEHDWLTPAAVQEKIQIPAGEALLFSMPVYGGFIPHICAERVSTLEGITRRRSSRQCTETGIMTTRWCRCGICWRNRDLS